MRREYRERDIEDALCAWLKETGDAISFVLRQVRLPMGILDVVAITNYGDLHLFEIKRGGIKDADITQLMGYEVQLRNLISFSCTEQGQVVPDKDISIHPVIVGEYLSGTSADRVYRWGGVTWCQYEHIDNRFNFSLHDWGNHDKSDQPERPFDEDALELLSDAVAFRLLGSLRADATYGLGREKTDRKLEPNERECLEKELHFGSVAWRRDARN